MHRTRGYTNLVEGGEEGDRLDGLAEPHLVGEDRVDVIGPGEAQPVDALELVRVQRAARLRDVVRLLVPLLTQLQESTGRVTSQRSTKNAEKSQDTAETMQLDTTNVGGGLLQAKHTNSKPE